MVFTKNGKACKEIDYYPEDTMVDSGETLKKGFYFINECGVYENSEPFATLDECMAAFAEYGEMLDHESLEAARRTMGKVFSMEELAELYVKRRA
jgi:hypothetical protein